MSSMMPLKTYTNIWNAEKKLYRIQDINLPTPIGFRQLGLFATGIVLWAPLMLILQVPVSQAWGAILWGSVPIGLAVLGDKPIFGGKTVIQALLSWVRFLFTPSEYNDMSPVSKKEKNDYHSAILKVWVSSNETKTRESHIHQPLPSMKTNLNSSEIHDLLMGTGSRK